MLTGSLLLNSLALWAHWRWFGFLDEEPRGLGLDRMPGRIRGNDGARMSGGAFEAFDQAGRASVRRRKKNVRWGPLSRCASPKTPGLHGGPG